MEGGGDRGKRKIVRGTETRREEARRDKTTYSAEEGASEKYARTDKSYTEIDTAAGGEAGTS